MIAEEVAAPSSRCGDLLAALEPMADPLRPELVARLARDALSSDSDVRSAANDALQGLDARTRGFFVGLLGDRDVRIVKLATRMILEIESRPVRFEVFERLDLAVPAQRDLLPKLAASFDAKDAPALRSLARSASESDRLKSVAGWAALGELGGASEAAAEAAAELRRLAGDPVLPVATMARAEMRRLAERQP